MAEAALAAAIAAEEEEEAEEEEAEEKGMVCWCYCWGGNLPRLVVLACLFVKASSAWGLLPPHVLSPRGVDVLVVMLLLLGSAGQQQGLCSCACLRWMQSDRPSPAIATFALLNALCTER
jgi:hypothetical protein